MKFSWSVCIISMGMSVCEGYNSHQVTICTVLRSITRLQREVMCNNYQHLVVVNHNRNNVYECLIFDVPLDSRINGLQTGPISWEKSERIMWE